jgi:BON domain
MAPTPEVDRELELNVLESLREFIPLRYTTIRYTPFRSVEIQVQDGIVRLSGHVATELHRREAVRRAAAVPGVRGIEDRIVTDEWLEEAVAQAMLPHRELQPSRVRISASLGKIVLEGDLDSARDVQLATAVAAAVPGVVSVESRLRAAERQGVAPPPDAAPPDRREVAPGAAPVEPRLVLIEVGKPCPPWHYAGVRTLKIKPPAS